MQIFDSMRKVLKLHLESGSDGLEPSFRQYLPAPSLRPYLSRKVVMVWIGGDLDLVKNTVAALINASTISK